MKPFIGEFIALDGGVEADRGTTWEFFATFLKTTEEIISSLRHADGVKTIEEVRRETNVSEQPFCRSRRKFGRMEMAEAKHFKEMENENSELKKVLTLHD